MNASTKNIFSSFLAVSLLCIPTLSGCDTAEQSGEAMKGIEALDDVAEGDELLAVEDDIAAPVFYAESARALPDQYIVVMKNTVRSSTVDDLLLSTALRDGDEINETYDSVLVGFSGRFSPETIEDLRHDPDVAYIEQDQYVELSGVASWGLDRIDQAGLPLDNQLIRPGTGDGVHTYIMDTGVRLTHNEFAGRIGFGFTTIYDGRGYDDCHGHGTHVAGTVAGTTYGVAPDAIIHPVRIFSCTAQDTSLSMIINAMNWVRYNHQSPAVVNMSFGSNFSQAVNDAVENLHAAGVTVVAAAGNNNGYSCHKSPASAPSAITVGATRETDYRASFSNWGKCVDLFAPGTNIPSAGIAHNSATQVFSGTSMASPHVAGAAAIYLELNPDASPDNVAQGLDAQSIKDVVNVNGLPVGTPNKFVNVRFGTDLSPEPEPEPEPDHVLTGDIPAKSFVIAPDTGYWYGPQGQFEAKLTGPVGTNFNLYLQKYIQGSWKTIESATSSNSSETISTYIGAASHRLVIYSASGAGTYELKVWRP